MIINTSKKKLIKRQDTTDPAPHPAPHNVYQRVCNRRCCIVSGQITMHCLYVSIKHTFPHKTSNSMICDRLCMCVCARFDLLFQRFSYGTTETHRRKCGLHPFNLRSPANPFYLCGRSPLLSHSLLQYIEHSPVKCYTTNECHVRCVSGQQKQQL